MDKHFFGCRPAVIAGFFMRILQARAGFMPHGFSQLLSIYTCMPDIAFYVNQHFFARRMALQKNTMQQFDIKRNFLLLKTVQNDVYNGFITMAA